MLQLNPSLTPAQVSTILAASTTPVIGAPGAGGTGLIQATTALQLARIAPKAGTPMSIPATASLAAKALRSAADTAADLAEDPTSALDLSAVIDLASTAIAEDVQVLAAGLDSTWAMLSSGAMPAAYDTSQTVFSWG